jgi:hypothetical protein
MRILPAVEEEIRRVIRDERAKDPLISVAGLEEALEAHFERGFSRLWPITTAVFKIFGRLPINRRTPLWKFTPII